MFLIRHRQVSHRLPVSIAQEPPKQELAATKYRYKNEILHKKTAIPFVVSNKHVPLHPVKPTATADIAQLVEQRIRNA